VIAACLAVRGRENVLGTIRAQDQKRSLKTVSRWSVPKTASAILFPRISNGWIGQAATQIFVTGSRTQRSACFTNRAGCEPANARCLNMRNSAARTASQTKSPAARSVPSGQTASA